MVPPASTHSRDVSFSALTAARRPRPPNTSSRGCRRSPVASWSVEARGDVAGCCSTVWKGVLLQLLLTRTAALAALTLSLLWAASAGEEFHTARATAGARGSARARDCGCWVLHLLQLAAHRARQIQGPIRRGREPARMVPPSFAAYEAARCHEARHHVRNSRGKLQHVLGLQPLRGSHAGRGLATSCISDSILQSA